MNEPVIPASNQSTDEIVKPQYRRKLGFYDTGFPVRDIESQIAELRKLFPNLGTANKKLIKEALLLKKAKRKRDEWFAVPRWEKIESTYNAAVQKIFSLIKNQRNGRFLDEPKDMLDLEYMLRHSKHTAVMLEKLSDQQKDHDILILEAQLGEYHCGGSIPEIYRSFTEKEFGLTTFIFGVILLTHPERLQHQDDLYACCIGDDCVFSDRTVGIPAFTYSRHRLNFEQRMFKRKSEQCLGDWFGCPSGFIR